MSVEPFVSVIVPTWNGKDYIAACLDSVFAQDYPAFEVIVVDNASTDGTPELIASHYPQAQIVRNKQNLGFAGGVNTGIRIARGDVIVLFNQDAVAEDGWLRAMVSGLLAEADIGIAGCKILDTDGQTLQHAGGYVALPQAFAHHFGQGQSDSGQYDQAGDVEFVTGAACAIRRCLIERIGYLDERFFFYYEDVDYCFQARMAGFRVRYIPDAVVRHSSKSSLGDATSEFFAQTHLSRLRFVLKHLGTDYFSTQFCAAEVAWLAKTTLPAERSGVREAYQNLAATLLRSEVLSPTERLRYKEIVSTLYHLRSVVYRGYLCLSEDNTCHALGSLGSNETATLRTSPWWVVKEQPFASHVPFLGGCIAWIRQLFNDISTTWFVRAILLQQNQVNQNLAMQIERHAFMLRDTDRDVIRLMLELADIRGRLQEIEGQSVCKRSWIEGNAEH